jgi:hypothetical protein
MTTSLDATGSWAAVKKDIEAVVVKIDIAAVNLVIRECFDVTGR